MRDGEKVLDTGADSEEVSGPLHLQIPSDAIEAQIWLRERLLEGLESEESIEMTAEAWEHLRDEALARTAGLRKVS